jgi:hypothetical protein
VGGPGPVPGGIRPLRPHEGIRCTPRIPGRKTGFQSGTVVDRWPTEGRSSDGVEPGHTPRPRGRSKGAHAVEFSKTVAPLREGGSFPRARPRTSPISERTGEYSARIATWGRARPRRASA